jgi:hypothetical protein
VLTASDEGIEILPVLSGAAPERILDGVQAWPHGLQFGGRDALREPETVAFAEPEETDLFEDAVLEPRQAPPLTAGEAPPLVPATAVLRGGLREIRGIPGVLASECGHVSG